MLRRITRRTQLALRRFVGPDEILREPKQLLDFSEHSYVPPTLLSFGPERDVGKVSVGKYSSLNGGTRIILGGLHHTEWVSTYPFRIRYDLSGAYEDGHPFTRGPVIIGSDVWIGYDVVILSGLTIGHGAVVGTGSLVTRDVPPYSIVAGNPAKELRKRFDEPTIDALLRIAWWDWPHDKVIRHVADLNSADVAAFIQTHDPMRAD